MTPTELASLLQTTVDPAACGEPDASSTPTALDVAPAHWLAVAEVLHTHESLYFDLLSCLTGLDLGPEAGQFQVIYHLYSIPYHQAITIRVAVPRDGSLAVPSVSHLWRTADWHEREAYDLVGIPFANHPDLRRILLPHDWHGHPLQKDYQEMETYHGIKVKY